MRLVRVLLATAVLALPATAGAQVLNFEGTGVNQFVNTTAIGDFYNGGVDGFGLSGTNYGISFSSNTLAICLNTLTVFCSNTSRGGLGDPSSATGGAFFAEGSDAIISRASGFTTGFSFFYSNPFDVSASFDVFDGENGTGTLLGSLSLGATPASGCPLYFGAYCPFVAAGLSFSGTAKSVVFEGGADRLVFDDFTFGSAIAGGGGSVTPEPGTLSLLATGLVGLVGVGRRRRKA